MHAVKENLVMMFNNPEKGAVTHAIVHRALWEYLSAVNDTPDDAEREEMRREIFETCVFPYLLPFFSSPFSLLFLLPSPLLPTFARL